MFVPEEDGTYYISASSYTNNPEDHNNGTYTVSVVVLDLPTDIEGTDVDDKIFGTDGGEKIAGNDGNDAIYAGGGDDEIEGGDGHDLLQGAVPAATRLRAATVLTPCPTSTHRWA